MKRFLLSLLILVMFTPSLACARFMHVPKSHMTKQTSQCPKHSQKSNMSGGMLFKDCAKIDLQHATDAPLVKKVVDTAETSPYALPRLDAELFDLSQARLIRGPPDPPEIVRSPALPVFLATQRLRI